MDVLTGLGLAAPAGLNAPLVLLLVALADRTTGLVDLPADYDFLSSWPAIGTLAALLLIEEVVDKIAGADHVNDLVQTLVRPAAGALVMLATTHGDLPPEVAGAAGLVLAGSAHATKAGLRPLVTVGTLGMGNPVVSVVEDVVAVRAVLVALLVPVLVVLTLPAWLVLVAIALRRARRRTPAAAAMTQDDADGARRRTRGRGRPRRRPAPPARRRSRRW